MSDVLRTEQLVAGHGRTPLLQPLGLHVGKGELVALIGINGSGKSTLLRTLGGLLRPVSGSIHVHGTELGGLSAAQRARIISVVLTGRPAAGLLDVRTLVSLGRQPWTGHLGDLRAADHAKVDDALERAGAAHLEARGMQALSDGELQKVMIARALAQDTPVMLLDEPTAFLDLVNRVRIVQLLRVIAQDLGKTILFSTHDLRTALDLCSRILLIDAGSVWSGTPSEALSSGVLANTFMGAGLVFDPASAAFRPGP